MYARTGKSYYDAIAIDTALIVVNDVIAQGALPVVFTDQLEASGSAWYADEKRAGDLAAGSSKYAKRSAWRCLRGSPPASPTSSIRSSGRAHCDLERLGDGHCRSAGRLVTGRKLTVTDAILA